ncbi:hypothetical protein GGR25_002676 [Kaistia hirudinis]|uniref:Uncharacterized protein n=1 Tax=Kaistia hirudinis TaxID=1293440 RepID=A0A840ATF1_9HYPH|nr:hypothetical protein [Kaistia hirudinis]MBB3931626.1 hypothetical protein [Kaistia hirudinis]MBN9016261.1 hypothetical protein [Hyphomicrobiales bacterium]
MNLTVQRIAFVPTTANFAAMDDHARLPWRFFSRLQATEDRGSGRL